MRTILSPVIVAAIVLAGCGGPADSPEDGIRIVVTTNILGDVVGEILEDDATVEVLIPSGASPHDYQASSRQVAAVNTADLVVANGFGLEEGLHDVLEAARRDGIVVIDVAPAVHPLPSGSDDPHFWLDPLRMVDAVEAIGAALNDVAGSIDWTTRIDAYIADLLQLDREMDGTLAEVAAADRKMVTNHDSFAYFEDRYGFKAIGVIIPGGSSLGDPSSEELGQLVEVIEAERVPAIFAETTEASTLAAAVAAEVDRDIEVVDLYTGSLGEPGSGADSYIGMMSTNAHLIADALS